MGKILKYCNTCEEGFAERFSFCPDCGGQLVTVEVNPVETKPSAREEVVEPSAPVFLQDSSSLNNAEAENKPVENIIEAENQASIVGQGFEISGASGLDANDVKASEALNRTASGPESGINSVNDNSSEENATYGSAKSSGLNVLHLIDYERPTARKASGTSSTDSAKAFVFPKTLDADGSKSHNKRSENTRAGNTDAGQIPPPILSRDDDGFHVTVIEDKDTKRRNWLLLGSAVFVFSTMLFGLTYSLFSAVLDVGPIGDDRSIAFLLDDVPLTLEEEMQKKANDKGGGGGGGGREDKEPPSQGDMADQSRTPIRPPDAKVPRLDNPSLTLPPPQTEGDRKFPKEFDRWGDPNSKFGGLSNGPGTGGGLGTGNGTGQGSGFGTGAGGGSGSGCCGGNGDGIGDGDGSGDGAPPPVAKVTKPLKIIYKQKAEYTDEARQNNIQGAVTLRVTFLASGQIGSITTIKGLPYGLTERAIAAARAMKFEPEMVNGVPRTTTRPVTFTFSLY